MEFNDLTGKRFEQWIVLARASNGPSKMTRYLCRCDCGQERIVQAVHLTKGRSTKCWDCYKSRYGQSALDVVVKTKYNGYKQNAKAKGRDFELSLEAFKSLVVAPCHYCGIPPTAMIGGYRRVKKRKFAPVHGVDRVDNSKPYLLTNCVSCCSDCNYMKKGQGLDDFIQRCIRIAERHGT